MGQRGFLGDTPFPQNRLRWPSLAASAGSTPPYSALRPFRAAILIGTPAFQTAGCPPHGTAGYAETLPKNRHRWATKLPVVDVPSVPSRTRPFF